MTYIQNKVIIIKTERMDLIKVLAKKHVRTILHILDQKGELYFGQINEHVPISKSTLSAVLSELVRKKLVEKRRGNDKETLPKTYYKLSELGKTALTLYDIADDIERLKKNQPLTIKYQIINGHKNIINSNISKSHIDIK